jgi:hypothetical protein
MFIGKQLRFLCDLCQKEATASVFPNGWVWIKRGVGNPVGHACEACKAQVPEEQRRNKGEKN